jgi:hypothetical protein
MEMFRWTPLSYREFPVVSEKSEIRRDGAKAQNNSGRGQISKGDAKWHNFLVDYKESIKTFGLSKSVWAKICTDTFRVDRNRSPILKVILGEGGSKTRLAVLEWSLLEELLETYENANENGKGGCCGGCCSG